MKKLKFCSIVVSLAVFLLTDFCYANVSVSSLRFIGHKKLKKKLKFKKTLVGGLSGVVYDSTSNKLLVVSDDKGEFGHPRFYHFDFKITSNTFDVSPSKVTILHIPIGKTPIAKKVVDLEGIIILDNKNILLSSEGHLDKRPIVPPGLLEFSPEGALIKSWPLPEKFIPQRKKKQTKGIYFNLGLESLTSTPDKSVVFTASEQGLRQDDAMTTIKNGSIARLVKYKKINSSFAPHAEYAYYISPIPNPTNLKKVNGDNGLPELLALDENNLLALERSYVHETRRNIVKLFKIEITPKSTDISKFHSLKGQKYNTVQKKLLLDLDTVIPQFKGKLKKLDNFEGMCIGPKLPNGNSTLILVSDNNFNRKQKTLFFAFEIIP